MRQTTVMTGRFWRPLGSALLVLATSVVLASGLASSAWAAGKFETLHKFKWVGPGGLYPYAGLVLDSAGNLYGTTVYGGNLDACYDGNAPGCGVVIEVTPNGDGSWKEKVLHSFRGGKDGAYPYAGVILDSAGNLYGTTAQGGSCGYYYGCGVVFELTPNGDGRWKEKVLHSFSGGKDGDYPSAGLIFDSAGNLYGTTGSGGNTGSIGTVFELTPNKDGSWKEKVLHSFEDNGKDGLSPYAGLIFDSAGSLYGTTYYGGAASYGTVFELTPNGDGSWKEKVLHSFTNEGTDGLYPNGGVILDPVGNLYGTTLEGGVGRYGTVFQLTPRGNGSWKEEVICSLDDGDLLKRGLLPYAGLVIDSAGNLYGTASHGGRYGSGIVFRLERNGNGVWRRTVLHSFRDAPGTLPLSGLIFDRQGNLYGTTHGDPEVGTYGSVFEISP